MNTNQLLQDLNIVNFIQIGAFDGKTNDPLHDFLFASTTARGVVLEPQEDIFQLLKETYSGKENIIPVNAAIYWTEGTQEFYTIRKDLKFPKEVYQLSSFNKQILSDHSKYIKGLDRYIVSVDVPTVTIDGIVNSYNLHPLDLIQIDAEGFDYEIIKMIEKSNLWPKILRFEIEHLNNTMLEEIFILLKQNNYNYFKEDLDLVAFKNGL